MTAQQDPALVKRVDLLLRTVRHFHDWLRSFHAVAYFGSSYQAAREVGMSCATNVKRHIRRLEKEWGASLVEPGDQAGTPLTQAGDALYSIIHPLFAADPEQTKQLAKK
jgi:molybdenum-dependent DNA-binding transcriptional regulator ModE